MRHSDFKRLGTFLFILFILFQIQACQRDARTAKGVISINDSDGEPVYVDVIISK